MRSPRVASRALPRALDFHDAQFLGSEGSPDAADSDGDVPEEHAGFGTFLHANGNGPVKLRFSWRAGSLTRNFAVVACRSAISL
jgi:hypothetical protein